MFKKEKIKIIIAIIISITLFCGFFIISNKIPKEISPPPNITKDTKKTANVILEINSTKYESDIGEIKNVYELMEKLKKERKINFKDTTYSGMGKFIEEINGIKNNGEKYWIYYVNNKKANIGVSNYKIKKEDIVSWKYEKETN